MLKKSIWVVLLTAVALSFSSNAYADSSSVFSIDVSDAALQLTVPSTASIELNPTSSSAVFGSTNLTLNVATNNITGYRIIMSVPNTNLTHNNLSNTVISTLSATSAESNFPANAWGYKVVGDDYQPILTSNTPSSWVVEEPTNGTNHTMTLAAKVDGTKPSGDYTNILSFQAVANPNTPKDTVVFNGNGADGGTMANQQIWQGEYNKLKTNTYTKTGYLFNGWNTKTDGTGAGYGDEGDIISNVSATTKTINLYAQWLCDSSVNTCDGVPSANGSGGNFRGKTLQDAYEMAYVTNPGNFQEGGNNKKGLYVPEKDPSTGEYTGNYFEATKASDYEGIPANDLRFAIQDIDLEINGTKVCDYATVIGSEAYVLDLRDNKSYWVAKLKDGKCWMTQNLDLDFSASKSYTPADTDLTTNWTPERNIGTINVVSNRDQAYGYAYSDIDPYGVDPGELYTYPTSDYSKYYRYASLNDCVAASNDKTGCLHYKVGNWYNWTASLASNDTSATEYSIADQDFSGSICPRGWRLPTAGLWNGLLNSYIPPNAHLGSWAQIYGEPPIYLNRATTITLVEWGQYIGTFWFDGGDPGSYQVASTVTEPGSGVVVSRTMTWKGCISCMNEAGVTTGFYTSSYGGYGSKDDGYNVRCIAK